MDNVMRKLKVEELFLGMWVQQWHEIPCRFSPPMQVTGIFGDGDMYLEIDKEQGDPFEGNLSDTFGLPIEPKMLELFGFKSEGKGVYILTVRDDVKVIVKVRDRYGKMECWRVSFGGGKVQGWNEDIRYFHELQRWFFDKVTLPWGIGLELNIEY